MTPLVANIRNVLDIVRRHSVLIAVVFCVLMAASVVLILEIPREYQAAANVLIVNGTARNDPTLSSIDLPDIVGGTDVLQRVRRKLGLSIPLLTMKKHVLAKAPAYRSGIMRIQYTDTDRDRAATIVNGIADELATYYTQLSTARYDDDLRDLDLEIAKQKARLRTIDSELSAQGGSQALQLEASGSDNTSSDSDLTKLDAQRAIAYADLQGDLAHAQAASVGARHDILSSDPLYLQLQASLTKASAELADARARYTPDYPGLSDLQSRVSGLRASVAQEAERAMSASSSQGQSTSPDQLKAEAAVEADRAKVAALDQELSAENNQVNVSAPVQLLRLERQQVVREYQSIAARRATSLADRADALSLGSVEVVDRAIPSEEVPGPGPIRLTLIALILASIISIGAAYLADQLDPRIRRITQIEGLYGKPLIATLKTSNRDSK